MKAGVPGEPSDLPNLSPGHKQGERSLEASGSDGQNCQPDNKVKDQGEHLKAGTSAGAAAAAAAADSHAPNGNEFFGVRQAGEGVWKGQVDIAAADVQARLPVDMQGSQRLIAGACGSAEEAAKAADRCVAEYMGG